MELSTMTDPIAKAIEALASVQRDLSIVRWYGQEVRDIADVTEAEIAEALAALKEMQARINDLHAVPPEHESEPLAFHKGWELAIRCIAGGKP